MLDGDPSPPKRGTAAPTPLFGPMYCGQTAGWTKMPLGTEVGIGPRDIVLDGDLAPPKTYCGTEMVQVTPVRTASSPKSKCPNFTKFSVHATCGYGLARSASGDSAIDYVFPVLWMTSRFDNNGSK